MMNLILLVSLLCLGRSGCQATTATAAVLYENSENVKTIAKNSDFKKQVLQSDGIWIVQFYSPQSDACKQFVPQYEQIALIMRGIFHVAAVDSVSTEAGKRVASNFAISDSSNNPTFYLFGNDKMNPIKYEGARDIPNLSQAMLKVLVETVQARAAATGSAGPGKSSSSQKSDSSSQPSRVLVLNNSNFAEKVYNNPLVVAVAFIAPWCGHCQRLLPEWEQAAAKLYRDSGAVLALVDATVETELAALYKVKGYPTIKIFPGGANKTLADAKEYTGGRTAPEIIPFVLGEVDRTGVPQPIPQLTGPTILQETCQGHKNHLCVLAALPHILDSGGADGRNKYLDLLARVAKTFRGTAAFSFLWFEGSSQPELENALELTFGFPALVAVSFERQAYAVLRGSFTEKAVTSFLHGITTGRQPTVKLDRSIPTAVNVEPWDGKDGVPVEEEIPLSEIMGWDDEDGKGNEL